MTKPSPLYDVLFRGGGPEDFGSFHIDPAALDDLIFEHGVYGEWRRSVTCPCARLDLGSARANCPHCLGFGITYPVSRREPMAVLLHSRAVRLDHGVPGWREFTTAQAILPTGTIPGIGDQFYPDCEVHVVQQSLVRGRNEIDSAALRGRETAPEHRTPPQRASDELLLYEKPKIESAYWISPRPGAPDEALVEAVEGRDFAVHGQRLVWAAGTGPEPGNQVTVRYQAPAAYVALKAAPVLRSEAGVAYPYRVEVERLDVWAAAGDLADHRGRSE